MAADPSYERARVDTGARSDERNYERVAPSTSLEEGTTGERSTATGRARDRRSSREERQQRWRQGPPYTFPVPSPEEIVALGSWYRQRTGRSYTTGMNGALAAVLRVHGPDARAVLEEELAAGGADDLLLRARCRQPQASGADPGAAPSVLDEPIDIADWFLTQPPLERDPDIDDGRGRPFSDGPSCPRCGGPTDPTRSGPLCRQMCHLEAVNDPSRERRMGR